MRIDMQQTYYCILRLIVIWFLLLVTRMGCTCSAYDEENSRSDVILKCVETSISEVNSEMDQWSLSGYAITTLSISDTPADDFDFIALRSDYITHLELINNNLTTIIPGFFQQFRETKILSLAYNNLSAIIEGIFREMINLQQINLSNNQIQQLKTYTFIGLKFLTDIDLSYNHLQYLPEGIFSSQTEINRLNIAHNNIILFFSNIFGATTINKLDVSFNQIEIIKDSCNCKHLDLSYNIISEIDVNAFNDASNLEEIYLQHNALSTIPSNVFINLPELKVLDLSYNNFSLFDKGPNNDWLHVFSPESLEKVLIDHNPWPCGTLRDIVTGLRSRKIKTGNYNSPINNSNVLGIKCVDDPFQNIHIQKRYNDSVTSTIFDRLDYLQKSILQLIRDTQSNITHLKNDIIQFNKSVLQTSESTNASLNYLINKLNFSTVDNNLLLQICKDDENKNFTKCLIKNIQEPDITDINTKLKEIYQQLIKLQPQDCRVAVDQSHGNETPISVIILYVLFILMLSFIVYFIYRTRKNRVLIKKEQIDLI